MRNTDLVLLRGPSSGGRNTIINILLKDAGIYAEFITDTTRPPRDVDGNIEKNGVDYWFRSEDEFINGLENGDYIEAEVIHSQQVSGMSIRELERIGTVGRIPILDIHFGGVDSIRAIKEDAMVIFITPPNFDEWVRRLRTRGTITPEEFEKRFKTSKEDYEHALATPNVFFVVNDDLEKAVSDVKRIIESNDYSEEENVAARNVAEAIYKRCRKEI